MHYLQRFISSVGIKNFKFPRDSRIEVSPNGWTTDEISLSWLKISLFLLLLAVQLGNTASYL
jgi:hypothetical protein